MTTNDKERTGARMYVYPNFLRIRGRVEAGIISQITHLLGANGFSSVTFKTNDLGGGFNASQWEFESPELSVEAADVISDFLELTNSNLDLITRICVPSCGEERWKYLPLESS